MLNPDIPLRGVSSLQATALLNATDEPQSPSALNMGRNTHDRYHLLEQLARAGFLQVHPPTQRNSRARYAITPEGRQLATLIERLEEARENH